MQMYCGSWPWATTGTRNEKASSLCDDHTVDAPVVDLVQRMDAPRLVLQLEEHLVDQGYRRRCVDQRDCDRRFSSQETLPLEQDPWKTMAQRLHEQARAAVGPAGEELQGRPQLHPWDRIRAEQPQAGLLSGGEPEASTACLEVAPGERVTDCRATLGDELEEREEIGGAPHGDDLEPRFGDEGRGQRQTVGRGIRHLFEPLRRHEPGPQQAADRGSEVLAVLVEAERYPRRCSALLSEGGRCAEEQAAGLESRSPRQEVVRPYHETRVERSEQRTRVGDELSPPRAPRGLLVDEGRFGGDDRAAAARLPLDPWRQLVIVHDRHALPELLVRLVTGYRVMPAVFRARRRREDRLEHPRLRDARSRERGAKPAKAMRPQEAQAESPQCRGQGKARHVVGRGNPATGAGAPRLRRVSARRSHLRAIPPTARRLTRAIIASSSPRA